LATEEVGKKPNRCGQYAQFWLCTWNQKEFFLFSTGKFFSAAPIIGHISLVGLGFNGVIGIGIIVNSLKFEIETKLSQCYTFVREDWLWCVRRVLSSLA
jgi:hypothetical protein